MSLLQSVFDGATAGHRALPIIGIITGGQAAGILGVYITSLWTKNDTWKN